MKNDDKAPARSTWYEKTVEYAFVLRTMRPTKPGKKNEEVGVRGLAGPAEKASDAVFRKGSTLVLVEFKRRETDLHTEDEKFKTSRQAAWAEMTWGREDGAGENGEAKQEAKEEREPEPHFLVYGQEGTDRLLELKACRYFQGTPAPIPGLLDQGVDEEEFKAYLLQVLQAKKDGSRSSGSVSPESILAVCEVENGQELQVASIEQFCEGYPELQVELQRATADSSASQPVEQERYRGPKPRS